MTDQQPQIGEIVEFIGYGELEDGQALILKEGQKLKIEDIGEDEQGTVAYRVRPITEDGSIDYEAGGDQIFAEEFKLIEPAIEPAIENEGNKKSKAKSKSNGEDKEDSEYDPKGPLMAEEGFEHDPVVTKLLRGTNNATELASSLYAEQEELYFKLGGILLDIQEKKTHVQKRYTDDAPGFAEYVKDYIGPERRHCYYLISIYKRFRKAGITAKDLKEIGWTKARLLLKVKDEHLNEWLNKASETSRSDLEAEIKQSSQNTNTETISKSSYHFTLYGDANTLVEQALDHAKQQVEGETEKESLNKAFEYICTQYVILEVDTNVEEKED